MRNACLKKKTLICVYMVTFLTVFLFRAGAVSAADDGALSSMKLVAENDALELYFDEEETGIAVKVKASGDVWFSNPGDYDSDTLASAFQKRQLRSQIGVRYFNENVQEAEMDNYSDCIAEGQFETEYTDDGVKIVYTLGAASPKYILPEVISTDRLEGFAAALEKSRSKKLLRNYTKYDPEKMKESDKKELTETYPGLEDHAIYVLKSSTKEHVREELAQYLVEAGYTQEDYDADLTDNGYESDNEKPWFKIPLSYKLDGDELVATVSPSDIDYNKEGYYLVDVELLPYFGAAREGSEGYIFVPDGSGALIDYDKKSDTPYTARVYGQDITMNVLSETASQTDQSLTVKLPVYGMKTGDSAWMAVIEDGDGYADITASTSGRINSYNNVYAGFQFLEYGVSSLGNVIGANSFQMYSQERFNGDYSIRFSFLSGEDADYSGMARRYRQKLEKNGTLSKKEKRGDIPFYAEYICAVDLDASFLGVKYRSVTPVTTYAQARDITGSLREDGVGNIKVILSGWANKGYHGRAYTKVKPIAKLERDGVSLNSFISGMKDEGTQVYLGTELQRVYRDGLFDGYSLLGYAPKYFDRSTVKEGVYHISNGTADRSESILLIRPSYAGTVADRIIKELSGKTGAGISISTISNSLYTDQQTDNYADRQDAKNMNESAVAELAGAFGGKVLGDNANAYMLAHLSDIIDVPLDSNRSLIISRVVPFYEMVLHGYMDYAGDCLNLTDDHTTTLLKSVESGAGLYYRWIHADNSVFKETDYDDMYSVNFENWLGTAAEEYGEVNSVLGPLEDVAIYRHEYIDDEAVRVTYENGTEVLVNYGDEDVVSDGVTVKAKSFAVVR